MTFYGVNGVLYDLLKSYLTQRQQIIKYNGCISDKLLIKAGVPQDSVLGPFSFLFIEMTYRHVQHYLNSGYMVATC